MTDFKCRTKGAKRGIYFSARLRSASQFECCRISSDQQARKRKREKPSPLDFQS
jgi:hypothetical protein